MRISKKRMEVAKTLAARGYSVVMSKDALSDGTIAYLARNPELKGCMSQGATPQEAQQNLEDARIYYIYSLLEDDLEVPAPITQQLTQPE